jgi:CzcA family heavy metal efflux pump
MQKLIVAFSIHFRGVVIALACLLAGYGLYTAARAKLDIFPEFAPPQVYIQTEAPGLSTEEVEALVTRPIENVVNGVGDLVSIRSQSIQGFSLVVAIFRDGTDIWQARQRVSERLVEVARQLPEGVQAPILAPLTSSTSLVLTVGLTSEKRTPMELRTFADWTVRPRLLGVPGVASVVEFGGEVRQLQVQLRPDRLAAYDLAIGDVIAAARGATGVRGAGFVETAAQRIPIQTEGQSLTSEALGEVVVAQHGGAAVRLKDVARVVEGAEPKLGDGAINGVPGIVLLVWAQFGANTLEVTGAVERALEELKPALVSAGITLHPRLFRPATFIETSIRNVNHSLLLGGILVAVVLFLFLLDLRAAFISFTAIPLSLLAAVIVLDRSGASINTITLGGFAIAIGVVVDDAIIGVENTWRRLRENRKAAQPRPPFQVVLDAAIEVRGSVIYATFIVALVFLPILAMSGVQGKLFAPLAVAFLLAVMASLVVALTVTVSLCFLLLARARISEDPAYIRGLKGLHRRVLEIVSRRPRIVMGLVLALCAAAGAAIPFFGGEFLPDFRESHFIVQMSAAPGTSAPESLRIGTEAVRELLKNPRIRTVYQQVGRAEQGEDTVGTDFSEFVVALRSDEGQDAEIAQEEIRQAVARFPGVVFAVKTFLKERIEETISGTPAELAIRIYGDDLDVIEEKAGDVMRVLSGIAGASDVQYRRSEAPQMHVRLRRDRLQQFGLRPLDVLEAVQAGFQGLDVAQVYDKSRVFGVAVILGEAERRDPESVGRLLLRTPQGTMVPLRELAEVGLASGRHAVFHDGTRRYQEVSCNVRGRDLESFVQEARTSVAAQVSLPAGVYTVFAGAAEAQADARRELVLHSIVAGVGIVILLSLVLNNLRNLLLVLANLPFALVGGVLVIALSGGSISVGSLVGFVTLFGITMRNSILMISHYEHLVAEEGCVWGAGTALRGASERLVPILMTAIVTGLGLVPLALGSGDTGREIEGPMATVILGGLATSTALNLLVLPALALRFGRFEAKEVAREA